MNKKTISFLLALVIVLSGVLSTSAAIASPASLESPESLSLRKDGESIIILRWTNPASILKVYEDSTDYGGSLSYLVDWKENDGQ